MYVYAYVYVYVYMDTYVHTHTHAHTHTHTYIHTKLTYTPEFSDHLGRMSMCMCTRTHTYTYKQTYIHTHLNLATIWEADTKDLGVSAGVSEGLTACISPDTEHATTRAFRDVLLENSAPYGCL